MYSVELYSRVRRACHVEGMSKSAAARRFGIARKTVAKMLKHAVPPGYCRDPPPVRPRLDPFVAIIDQILEEDKSRLKKPRHTAKRIHERLRDEHGFTGGITIVTDHVREKKRRTREVFVPLSHAPGHAQVDFGASPGVIRGVECKLHCYAMALPHSDAFFIKAYPAETTEAFCDGHVSTFAFFGGVPLSILYDNTTITVAKICGDGRRERTRIFSELQSHYLFDDKFGRPGKGKGNDKGNAEGVIGYGRRNFLVPAPRFNSFDELNAWLEAQCLKRQDDTVRERRLQRLQKLLVSQDLLIIDELGFVPLGKTGAELLFEVISRRYECGSIIITSNLPFDEWTEVFGAERLTGAILDRLTHHVHILEVNGESFRLRQSRKGKS